MITVVNFSLSIHSRFPPIPPLVIYLVIVRLRRITLLLIFCGKGGLPQGLLLEY